MLKAKLLVLGPCQSGKSVIANFLSDATETTGGDYRPTQGVRILEFEAPNINVNGRNVNAEVELWDVSGDKKYESCWPAIAKDSSGIIFVYNPDQANHDKEMENWYNFFVSSQKLKDLQCVVFAHSKGSESGAIRSELSPAFSKIPVIQTNLEEDAERVRSDFNSFLSSLLSAIFEKRDQEELNIMNSR